MRRCNWFQKHASSAIHSTNRICERSLSAASAVLEVRPVEDFFELCASFRLVHDCYVAARYMETRDCGMRCSALQLLPYCRTFCAVQGGQVLGTCSVVLDSAAGLPSSSIFGGELDELRAAGRRLAEGTMFACRQCSSSRQAMLNMKLLSAAYWWCRSMQVDSICVVVNPKHLSFYENVLGFERVSDLKSCSHVEGAPGLLLHLDARSHAEDCRSPSAAVGVERYFFSENGPARYPQRAYRLGEREVKMLLLQDPQILISATDAQRQAVAALFPRAFEAAEMKNGLFDAGAVLAAA